MIFNFLKQICHDDPSNWHNDYRYSQIIEILKENNIKFEEVCYNGGMTKNIYVHYGRPFVNIFGAHYDIVPEVQGAIDNGASVSELIGLAINLKEHAGDITIAFLANEENLIGLGSYDDVGSKCMALNELKSDYKRSIILDVCARGNVILTRQDCDIDFSGYKHSVKNMPITDDWIINNTMSTLNIDSKYDDRSLLLSVLPESDLDLRATWKMIHSDDDVIENVEVNTLEMMTCFITGLAHEISQNG
jgi:hypothetical protein